MVTKMSCAFKHQKPVDAFTQQVEPNRIPIPRQSEYPTFYRPGMASFDSNRIRSATQHSANGLIGIANEIARQAKQMATTKALMEMQKQLKPGQRGTVYGSKLDSMNAVYGEIILVPEGQQVLTDKEFLGVVGNPDKGGPSPQNPTGSEFSIYPDDAVKEFSSSKVSDRFDSHWADYDPSGREIRVP